MITSASFAGILVILYICDLKHDKDNQCLRIHTRKLRESTFKKLLPKNGATKPTKCYQSGKQVLFCPTGIDALQFDEVTTIMSANVSNLLEREGKLSAMEERTEKLQAGTHMFQVSDIK